MIDIRMATGSSADADVDLNVRARESAEHARDVKTGHGSGSDGQFGVGPQATNDQRLERAKGREHEQGIGLPPCERHARAVAERDERHGGERPRQRDDGCGTTCHSSVTTMAVPRHAANPAATRSSPACGSVRNRRS
jgi:hypothetical protein